MVRHIRIQLRDAGRDATIELDGVPIENATALTITAAVDEPTNVTLTLTGVDVDFEAADPVVELVKDDA
jgi:hypothetical protein